MSLPQKVLGGLSLFLTALITGCSTYQSVTAYFNTYYNASKLFDDAVTEIEAAPSASRDTNYFAAYNIPKSSEDKLDKVIEKCSKLIEFYPTSKWIPDAIMMIGRSYVYKGEDESALRKFSELLDNFPNSDHRFEAKLWSAIAKYQGKREDDALKTLKDLFPEARSEGKNDIMLTDLMLQGQIFVERAEYDQAAAVYGPATEISGDGKLRAIAQNQLAICYDRMGDKEKAAAAYGNVKKFSPDFALAFKARLKEATMLSTAGQYDRAFDRLDDLRREPLRPDERGLVELEGANNYRRMGDTARAIAMYAMIDTTYRRTDASAKSYYHSAVMYEKQFLDFKSARILYDKAKNEFGSSEITPPAQKKSLDFENYFRYYQGLHNYDSLLVVALHRDSIAKVEDSLGLQSVSLHRDTTNALTRSRADSLTASVDSLHRMSGAAASDTGAGRFAPPEPGSGTAQLTPPTPIDLPATPFKQRPAQRDSVPPNLAARLRPGFPPGGELPAEQLHRDSIAANNPAMARPGNEQGLRGREERPRFRRGTAETDSLVAGKFRTEDREVSPRRRGGPRDTADTRMAMAGGRQQPQRAVVLSPDSLRSMIAMTEFELGGLFFLELDHADSALTWYEKVVTEYPTSPLVPRALYAMAEIHRNNNDTAAVDSLYTIILERYGQTAYAGAVNKFRGNEAAILRLDSAEVEYAVAESLLDKGKAPEAIALLGSIPGRYPVSPIVPKALYAIGWIYESVVVDNDSASVWYKKLLKQYPTSVYAAAVQGKVAVKDDPKSLSQYVKIKEIQPLAKLPDKKRPGSKEATVDEQDEEDQGTDEEEIQRARRHEDTNDEDTQDDDDDSSNSDDDNNN